MMDFVATVSASLESPPHWFRNNCFGFRCRGFGYPWAYGGYYDPYWWWDSGSSYDEDYERDRADGQRDEPAKSGRAADAAPGTGRRRSGSSMLASSAASLVGTVPAGNEMRRERRSCPPQFWSSAISTR